MVFFRLSSFFYWSLGSSLLSMNVGRVAAQEELSLIVSIASVTDEWNFCPSCDDVPSNCPVKVNQGMHLAGVCYATSTGSSLFTVLESEICETKFLDQDCQETVDGSQCSSLYSLSCNATDPTTQWVVYPNFCIESTAPSGSFVTPLYEDLNYQDSSSCTTDTVGVVSLQYDGPTLCFPTAGGSAVVMCNGDDKELKYFSDKSCSVPDFTYYLFGGECTTIDEDGRWEFTSVTGCGNTKYFCKSFLEFGIYSEVNITAGGSSGGSSLLLTTPFVISVLAHLIGFWMHQP